MDEDLNKLPKWAREKIRVLEMHLREAQNTIALLSGNDPSKVYVRGYDRISDRDRPLGDTATVAFVVEHGVIEAHLNTEGGLYLAAYDGLLAIKPRASNCVDAIVLCR